MYRESGQALLEYLVVGAALLAAILVMGGAMSGVGQNMMGDVSGQLGGAGGTVDALLQ